jgi:hypothetical protein
MQNRPDWFSQVEQSLINLIDERNEAFKKFMKNLSDENHQVLKTVHYNLLREKR